MPAPGDVVGRFRLDARLGRGGGGEVWKGWDPELSRWVAIKFLKLDGDDDAERFRREAQTAAQLVHPNIAAIYEAAGPTIVMQYVEGATLRASIGADARVVAQRIRDAARALHFAHERGVIHRDVKPDNLMVDSTGRVFVMDFGLARANATTSSLSRSGMAIGTPSYMPPEQARGEASKVDARSDVYGLGATLYELLGGRPPFDAGTVMDTLLAVVRRDPEPLERLTPAIDPDLATIVMKCLEKERESRYATAGELAEDLDRWLKGEPVSARAATTVARVARWVGRHRTITVLGMVTIAAAAAAAGVVAAVQARSSGRQAEVAEMAALSRAISERTDELRRGRVPPEPARRALEAAVAAVDAFVERHPGMPQGWHLRARGRLELGLAAMARADAERSVALASDFRPGWILLGIVKLEIYRQRLYVRDSRLSGEQKANLHLLQEALDAFSRGAGDGRETEDAVRWGLPSSREDAIHAAIVGAYRLGVAGKNDEALEVIRRALREQQSEDLLLFQAAHLTRDRAAEEALLSEAVRLAPGCARAWFDRANVRVDLGRDEEALADFSRALVIQPDHVGALNNRGRILARIGRPGAREDFDRAIALDPDFPLAYENRSELLWNLGDRAGAMGDIDRALSLDPRSVTALCTRGTFRERAGDRAGALEDFEKALEINPRSGLAHNNRGHVRHVQGDRDGAMRDFNEAVRLAPTSGITWHNRGLLRADRGDFVGAVDDFTESIRLEPRTEVFVARAFARMETGDRAGARADYGRALELNPRNAFAFCNRGILSEREGDLKGALADFDRALELNARYSDAIAARATVLLGLGRREEALAAADRAIEIDPSCAFAYYERGRLMLALGRPEEAVADFTRAIRERPDFAEAYNNRGNAALATGRARDAVSDLTRAIELRPGFPEAWYNRGVARQALGAHAESIPDYTRAIELKPDYAEAHVNRGNARRRTGDLDGAFADYNRAIELAPGDFLAWANRGLIRDLRGDLAKAEADYDESVRINPRYLRGLVLRGDVRAKRGNPNGAAADYREALRLAPADWSQRADVEKKLKDVDR